MVHKAVAAGALMIALTGCAALGLGSGFEGQAGSGPLTPIPGSGFGGNDTGQALLASAWASAMATAQPGGFASTTPADLARADPSLTVVGDAPAKVGVISLNHAGKDGLVMSTKGTGGGFLCIAVTSASIPTTGSVDAVHATSVHDCSGKPWGPS
jgi:hypothetical protein